MDKPLVSVVIPTYNRVEETQKAVESVLDQTLSELECIVVDDCSEDDNIEIFSDYNDDRVKYVRHEENKGAAAARNTGVEKSEGEYIAFLDSDDRWMPGKLEKQVSKLESTPENTKVCYCGRFNRLYNTEILMDQEIDFKEGDIQQDLLKGWMDALTSQLVVEKSCFSKVKGFDEDFPSFQEYDLLVRLTEHYEVCTVGRELVERIEGGESISSNYENRLTGLEKFVEKHRERLEAAEGISPEEFYSSRITGILGNKAVHKLCNGDYREGLNAFRRYQQSHDSNLRPWMVLPLALIFSEKTYSKITLTEKVLKAL